MQAAYIYFVNPMTLCNLRQFFRNWFTHYLPSPPPPGKYWPYAYTWTCMYMYVPSATNKTSLSKGGKFLLWCCVGGSITRWFGFINWVDNVNWHRKEIRKLTFRIRSDEGLTLETPASESLYGGQFTLSTHLITPNYQLCTSDSNLTTHVLIHYISPLQRVCSSVTCFYTIKRTQKRYWLLKLPGYELEYHLTFSYVIYLLVDVCAVVHKPLHLRYTHDRSKGRKSCISGSRHLLQPVPNDCLGESMKL